MESMLVARRPRRPPAHLAELAADQQMRRLEELGEPTYRAKQLATHYFAHYTTDPSEMTDLPKASRAKLVEALLPPLLSAVSVQTADRGTTVKTLWSLFDGVRIESVLMRYPNRSTLCLSTQAGCGMGCPFCATGQQGLIRNLSASEMMEQVRMALRSLARGEIPGGRARLDNVVLMGMGEGLANYRAVLDAIRVLIAEPPAGFGLSARGITLSTVGLAPGIRRLSAEGLPITLALSLHAPDDALRDELVPINRRWPVAEVLAAARHYFEATGRRVSIEYALIRNVNDQAWRADLLAERLLAHGRGWVHVNPIPLNPTPGSKWTASDPAVERHFVARLRKQGIPTTIRDTRGSEIAGACGQLADTEPKENE